MMGGSKYILDLDQEVKDINLYWPSVTSKVQLPKLKTSQMAIFGHKM